MEQQMFHLTRNLSVYKNQEMTKSYGDPYYTAWRYTRNQILLWEFSEAGATELYYQKSVIKHQQLWSDWNFI